MANEFKANNKLILILVILYVLTILYNIVHFHRSGLGSSMGNEMDDLKDSYKIKVDDDVSSKLHIGQVRQGNNIVSNTPKNDSKLETDKLSHADIKQAKSSYREESNVFKKMLDRSTNDAEVCSNLHPDHLGKAKEKDFDTGVPPLPENGIHEQLQKWLDGEFGERGDYPMCELPPTKSCDVDKYSLILMSHTVKDSKRLGKLINGIKDFAARPETEEIILVWNSEKANLVDSNRGGAKSLVEWDNDESHPLRIFYSLENGLQNNLLNRYHPMIKPKSKAIMYFDDDGPFYDEGPMRAGFALWKYNSDVQIGSLTRNIRYPSKRMNDMQNEATDLAAEHYRKDSWQTHVHPYDTEAVGHAMKEAKESEPGYPKFTPLCRDETGDNVEYNYFVFPNFKAHMSLPSGSMIHRNYLCFVWHPVFTQMRQFILDHPTHPDDMTISTLVSHLSGKPLRTFPRQFKKNKRRNLSDVEDISSSKVSDKKEQHNKHEESLQHAANDNVHQDQKRRKLLWQQKDWGNMREEAINSILGYFGSINPGSVGWCAGTEYEKPAKGKGNMRFNCVPEFPEADMIPWMHKGGLGYDECPKK